jgi:hypothetical protein
MRSAFEIEERLRCALAGLENSRECGDIETQKEYANDAGVLFWVLGRSGSYDYKDGKVTLYDETFNTKEKWNRHQ